MTRISPTRNLLLGMAQERQRQFKIAVQEIDKYLEVSGQDPDALMKLGVAYAHSGDGARALRMIAEMRKPTASRYVVPFYYIADIYAALGDKEAAFEWLDRAPRPALELMSTARHRSRV